MSCGIYRWTDGEKTYIGQSIDIEKRKRRHLADALRGIDTPLYKAMRDHLDRFSFEIVEECEVELLDAREKYYIQQFNCQIPYGFNQTEGGQGASHFMSLDQERLKGIIFDLINTTMTGPEIGMKYGVSHQMVYDIKNGKSWRQEGLTYPLRDNLNQPKQNKITLSRSEAQRYRNVFWCLYGTNFIPVLEEVIEHGKEYVAQKYNTCVKALRNYFTYCGVDYHQQELKALYNQIKNIIIPTKRVTTKTAYLDGGKKVYQLDKQTKEIINVFNSCVEAANYLGNRSYNKHISETCCGSRKSAYGYCWEYRDN